jgi:hypothetical protein
MATVMLTPAERLEAMERIRRHGPTTLDLAWLRIELRPTSQFGSYDGYVCDCRCFCHAGPCGRVIDLETLDCPRTCRSAHMLASDCDLDATRPRKAAHA